MYKEYGIEKFLSVLSSTKSMPGGGVATALLAANGVSLALKVCNLSIGKEKYREYEDMILKAKDELIKYNELFLKLMDDDAESFKAMEDVYKMKKDTDEEKKKRKAALIDACKKCCIVPGQIASNAISAIDVIKPLYGKSNVTAESDLKIAKIFLITSAEASWENIEINFKYIDDTEFKNKYNELYNKIKNVKEA